MTLTSGGGGGAGEALLVLQASNRAVDSTSAGPSRPKREMRDMRGFTRSFRDFHFTVRNGASGPAFSATCAPAAGQLGAGAVRMPRAMLTVAFVPTSLERLTRDGWLLFLTRFIRLFAYGSLSVALVFYLIGLGLSEAQTGLLLTLTLVGDTVVSLYLTTRADRIGRRCMLIVGAILMAAAGVAFACTHNFLLLILAGTIGVISPSGNEVGPFLPIEQAALSHVVPARTRTEVFAW